ncbi:hypothetical protein [Clostridium beijerinckii]|uniref:hypothetical protein n=1 Tax=Clostridium beijerinckii TaxID=1520 RepID=UPI001F4BF1AE|nr:hypothetical protein [Clostridium beijerinckii]NRZ07830.1 hypothetical protein [Clostridium beijerinckii]
MNTIEKVIMNLKIRPDGMNLYELDRICFKTYQKDSARLKTWKSKGAYRAYSKIFRGN